MTKTKNTQTEPILEKAEKDLDLPHHLLQAKDWDGLERVLCDLLFLEKKIADGLIYELNEDFQAALEALPENQNTIKKKREQKARLAKYTQDLLAYTRDEINKLEIIPSLKLLEKEELEVDRQRILRSPTRLDRLKAFAQFTKSQTHHFLKVGAEPNLVLAQAYGQAAEGPVTRAAEEIINSGQRGPMLLRHPAWRPSFNSHPSLLCTLEGHTDHVQALALTPDGRWAVSGGGSWGLYRDFSLRVWDLETGKCLRSLEGHKHIVNSVAISADGPLAVSGGKEKILRIWDLISGRCLLFLEGHTDEIQSVSMTADGRLAVSAGKDQGIRLWNLKTVECLRTMEGTKNSDKTVRITADGKQAVLAELVTHQDNMIGKFRKISRNLSLWDLKTGRCLKSSEDHTESFIEIWGGLHSVKALALFGDGRKALLGGFDGHLKIWTAADNRLEWRKLERDLWITGLSAPVDGRLAVSVEGFSVMENVMTIKVWDVATGCSLGTLPGHTDEALSVAISADGSRAVSCGADETLRVWDLEGIRNPGPPLERPRDLGAGALTADGQKALLAAGERSGSYKPILELWDLKTRRCLKTLECERINKVALTHNDRIAVTGSLYDSGLVQVWDLETGSCLRRFQRESRTTISDLILSADGRIALALIPKSVFSKKQDYDYEKHLLLLDLEKERCLKIMRHPGKVLFAAFLEDGRRAISACEDRIVRLWELKSGHCLRSQEVSGEITALNVSPDGRWVTTGTNTGHVEVWDLEIGGLTGREGHTLDVSVLAVTPEGRRILSGGQDGLLRLWNLENCRPLKILKGHTEAIISVVVTADGQKAVSHSRDQTLRLWDLETGLCRSAIRLDKVMLGDFCLKRNTILACSYSGDGEAFQIIEPEKENPREVPWEVRVTPVRKWHYALDGGTGHWDKTLSALCPICGKSGEVPSAVVESIRKLKRARGTAEKKTHDPALFSHCPSCGCPWQYNTIIVDNRDLIRITP